MGEVLELLWRGLPVSGFYPPIHRGGAVAARIQVLDARMHQGHIFRGWFLQKEQPVWVWKRKSWAQS